MTFDLEAGERLTAWLRTQVGDVDDVRVEGVDRVDFGHSAEMMVLTVVTVRDGRDVCRDVVLRLRPKPPALLEPYDLPRQFTILRALEHTAVRAPRALWLEDTGEVLGRPFLVMECVAGDVYEMDSPAGVSDDTVAQMCRSMVEQLAAIHSVDLAGTGLQHLGDGSDHLVRELDHWSAEMNRVKRGTLPALERLRQGLRETMPDASPRITLVHGDAKPGNFAFVGGAVSAVFDWEMTTVGDPLTDIGWLDCCGCSPSASPAIPLPCPSRTCWPTTRRSAASGSRTGPGTARSTPTRWPSSASSGRCSSTPGTAMTRSWSSRHTALHC